MNETDKPLVTETTPGKRPPVAWKITKMESQEMTVIFPAAGTEGSPAPEQTETT